MKKTITILVVFFLLGLPQFAEEAVPAGKTVADRVTGLEKRLEQAAGKERIDILNKISHICWSPEKSIQYGREALALSQELGCAGGEADAGFGIARGLLRDRNHEQSLAYLNRALRLYKKTGNKSGTAKTLYRIGLVNRHKSRYDDALDFFLQSEKVARETGSIEDIARALSGIGGVYTLLSRFDKALDYHIQASKLAEKSGDNHLNAYVSFYTAVLHSRMGKMERALEYFSRALKNYRQAGDKIWITQALLTTGAVHENLNNSSKSLACFQEALKIAGDTGDKKGVASVLNSIGYRYLRLKDFPRALDYLHKSLKISEEIGKKNEIAIALGNIGNIYHEAHNYSLALTYFRKALALEDEVSYKDVILIYLLGAGSCCIELEEYDTAEEFLTRGLNLTKKTKDKNRLAMYYHYFHLLYKHKKDYKKALEYSELFSNTNREVLNETSMRQVNEMQEKYEAEKLENENRVLKQDNEIQELKLSKGRLTRNVLFIGFVLLLLILALLSRKYLYLFSLWKKDKIISQFRLVEKVGSGGMGTVYKAHTLKNKSQIFAVKILHDELFRDKKNRKRFKREAAIIDNLRHPNIIRIVEVGVAEDKLFIAMDYMVGQSLEEKIAAEGTIALAECLHIMRQIADAVAYIHNCKIIHRDLKPGNIMLVEQDGDPNFVKLLDFGLARAEFQTRLTQSGNLFGTIDYMAPESIMGIQSTPKADIFSMGVIFYRLLCGSRPFPGENVLEQMRHLLVDEPPQVSELRPEAPEELSRLVMHMMCKESDQRPTSAAVLKRLKKVTL